MQQIIMANAPYVTLYQPLITSMASKNVGGFYLSPVTPWYDLPSYWRVK
jgi:ABC-type transport system substrate-binding protein